MTDRRIPVEHQVSRLARRVVVALVFTPTAVLLVFGVALKIVGGAHGEAGGGALVWILLLVMWQALALALFLGHWPWAAKMVPDNPPEPPRIEPGIFRP